MATTTIMKDSQVGDEWIKRVCADNPVQRVIDEKTGQPNGNILSGPVRLAFTDALFEMKPKMKSDPNSKMAFSCTILFPPIAKLDVLFEEYNRIAQTEFAGQAGLDPALRDQAEKPQFSGFTPGGAFTNISSGYKPAIVDMRMNPIVDRTQIYAGCWAIVALSAYASGKGTPRKGPRFGLQTIMKIGDDMPLAGAAPDPRAQYGSVKVVPPTGPVASQFGQGAPQQGPQSGQAAVGTFYPQGGGSKDDDVSGFM